MTVYPHENGDRDGTFTYKILKGGKVASVLDMFPQTPVYLEYMERYNLADLTRRIYESGLSFFSIKILKDILEIKKESSLLSIPCPGLATLANILHKNH